MMHLMLQKMVTAVKGEQMTQHILYVTTLHLKMDVLLLKAVIILVNFMKQNGA